MGEREFGLITTSLWGSERFKALPDADARLMYIWLHTNPYGNCVGCYRLTVPMVPEILARPQECLEACHNFGLIDREGEVIRITRYLEHVPILNWQAAASGVKVLLSLGPCELTHEVCCDLIQTIGFQKYAAHGEKWNAQRTIAKMYERFGRFDLPDT